MMKKFSKNTVSSRTMMKASAYKQTRIQILQQYPRLEHILEDILPKKKVSAIAKCPKGLTLLLFDSKYPLFFKTKEDKWIPTLRLVHRYPTMLPRMQVDEGAVPHILKGSNIMCPGLTSSEGKMENVENGVVVQVVAPERPSACCIGITRMSTQDIITINKDTCIENMHYLFDGLWHTPSL